MEKNIEQQLKNYGVIDEMESYSTFDGFYKDFLNAKQKALEDFCEVIEDLTVKFSKQQLYKIWLKHEK